MESKSGDVEVIFSTADGWPDDNFNKNVGKGRNDKKGDNAKNSVAWNSFDEAKQIPQASSGVGPVDLDDCSLLSGYSDGSDSDEHPSHDVVTSGVILKKDLHNIPGSPWAKPGARHSQRPTEPLSIAKYSSQLGCLLTVLWVAFLFVMALW